MPTVNSSRTTVYKRPCYQQGMQNELTSLTRSNVKCKRAHPARDAKSAAFHVQSTAVCRCYLRMTPRTVNPSINASSINLLCRWKHSVTRKIHVLETFMDTVREKLQLPDMSGAADQDENFGAPPDLPRSNGQDADTPPSGVLTSPQPRTWEVRMDIESGPASIPASIVSEVRTDVTPTIPPMSADLVSRGVLSLEQADSLFDIYCNRLDHYLYRILGDSISLKRIRGSSPLLTAAVCSVGALHSPNLGFLYDKCLQKFQDLCVSLTFAKEPNLDDIRGLCIGAFWLHEISWTLVGLGTVCVVYYKCCY